MYTLPPVVFVSVPLQSEEPNPTRTVERDMPGSGATIVRNMTTDFPDPFCRFHQSQGPVIAEVWYEDLVMGRMRDHLMRV